VDQELNYFNYFTEIERFYQSKRASFTLLSTLDWVLIENWKEQGVPLEIVLKGIDRSFARAKRRINSLAYCVKAVEEVCEEQKRLQIEAPNLPDFQQEELNAYIAKLADDVVRVDEGIAASIRALDTTDLRIAEQSLSALEEKLIAKLKFTTPDPTMIEIKREVDEELNPFRSTMTAAQLTMLEQQMWRRKLLERHNVPRLSLFYLI
jgi:RNAse (barnase) inhibitor barstar